MKLMPHEKILLEYDGWIITEAEHFKYLNHDCPESGINANDLGYWPGAGARGQCKFCNKPVPNSIKIAYQFIK